MLKKISVVTVSVMTHCVSDRCFVNFGVSLGFEHGALDRDTP